MDCLNVLKALCSAKCVSYATPEFKAQIADILQSGCEFREDGLKNLYLTLGNQNAAKKVIIDAHFDRIGFVVTNILEGGFLRLEAVGGIDLRTILNQSLVSLDGKLSGVFCSLPPHLKSGNDNTASSLSELALDIGLSYEDALKNVKIGDLFCFDTKGFSLGKNRYCASGLDNAAGVCVLLCVVKKLLENPLKNTAITFLLSSGEEVGLRGASAFSRICDADEAIVIDTSFASAPSVPIEKVGNMSGGAMIGKSTVLSGRMSDELVLGAAFLGSTAAAIMSARRMGRGVMTMGLVTGVMFCLMTVVTSFAVSGGTGTGIMTLKLVICSLAGGAFGGAICLNNGRNKYKKR